MRLWVVTAVVMIIAGIVVWIFASDSAAGQAIALSLVGIASVIAVSLVFFLVGRSEDRERASASASPASPSAPEAPPVAPDAPGDPHPRPALDRRRPLPPRRPR